MIRKLFVAALPLLALAAPAHAQRAEIGYLDCRSAGGVHLIVTSNRIFDCVFTPSPGYGPPERYRATITRFGVDIGVTGPTALGWIVTSSTARPEPTSIAGRYGGLSGDVSAGLGLGGNIMGGGPDGNVMLQPFSGQAQVGLNLAVGVAQMRLDPVMPPRLARVK